MTPETIRAGRLARGWTQQQLAQHVAGPTGRNCLRRTLSFPFGHN